MEHDLPPTDGVASAVVMADGVATRYRRCGAGPTVVVLGAVGGLDALARSYRLIVPEVPPDASSIPAGRLTHWLSGVFDGLGIDVAVIVADASLAGLVAPFAAEAADRVRGVVVGQGRRDLTRAVGRCFG